MRSLRPSLESLESRLVMDGPGGSILGSVLLTPPAAPPVGAADDGWIQNFNHPLPDPSDATRTFKLGLLKFDSQKPWSSSPDGMSITFGSTDDDWTLIGLDPPGQPYKPILVARGVVTLTPDATKADPFGWSVGLYIVRNDGSNVRGAYQLLTSSGSLSADLIAGTPSKPITPPGAAISGALPLSMIADQANSGVSAAFTPTNMLLELDPETRRSVLRFAGGQSVAYKGSRFKFGLGGSSADAGKALTIDETGSLSLITDGSAGNSVTATASFGGDESVGVSAISQRINSAVHTAAPHNLAAGDAFQFEGLVDPDNVANDTTYYVFQVLDDETFYFSETPTGDAVDDASADAGGDVVVAGKFKAGGFSLAGNVQVTFAFLDHATIPDPKDGWSIKIAGGVNGEFAAASGVLSGSFGVVLGSSDFTVPGIVIQSDAQGTVTIPQWAFVVNGDVKFGKSDGKGGTTPLLDLTLSNVAATNTFDPTSHLGTLKINGGISLAVAGWSAKFAASLGDGDTHDGLVLTQDALGEYKVQSYYAAVTVTKDAPTKPADNATFADKLALHDFDLTLIGSNNPDGSIKRIDVTGEIDLAVGDQTPDGNGNWPSTISLVGVQLSQGGVIVTEHGLMFPDVTDVKLTASGAFEIGPLQLVAQNLVLDYHGEGLNNSNNYFLIGGTITLPQLKGVSVTLGDGGDGDGLKIFTSTGHWQLDGFKLVIPEIVVGPVELDAVTIGFSEVDTQNWTLLVGGTIVLFKEGTFQGTRITVKLELGEQDGNFIVEGFAVDLRGLDPGIPILDTGGFITDIGLDAENLDKSDFSIDAVIGAAFGGSIQVAGNSYSLVQITAEGKFTPGDLDITGQILLAGGLASGTAHFDADYAIGRYLIDINLQFLYDFLDGHIRVLITPGKLDALATLDLNVPDFIPIIGGYNIGEVGAALELTTERPKVASIASGVVTTADAQYLRVGDPFKFTYLDGASPSSFDLTQVYYVTSVGDGGKEFTFSLTVSGSPISNLSATGGKINPGPQIIAGWAKFLFWEIGIEYDFLAAKFETLGPDAIQQIKNNTPSGVGQKTYTYNSDFTPPAPASGGNLSTAASGLFQFPITGIDGSTMLYATVDGNTSVVWNTTTTANSFVDVGGIRFHYVTDLSMPSNILIHASAVPAAGGFDPYVPIPLLPITFTLTSDIEQPGRQTDPGNSKQGWHGKFTAPPPQTRKVAVAAAPTDALGNPLSSADPNLVTVSFEFRTTDPKDTLLNFFYDYDSQGADGRRFLTARVSDLQGASAPDADGWQSATVTWDLAGLADFPVFPYLVATDGVHSPSTPLYAAQSVLPQPQLIAQISVQNPDSEEAVSANDLPGWLFTVTPVKQAVVSGIAATSQADPTSLASTTAAHGFAPGQAFVFQQLRGASAGLVDGLTYYVATVPSPTTFTFAAVPSQGPVSGQTAQAATAFSVAPGAQPISILSDANGHANFYLSPQMQWVRVKIWSKQPGFIPLPNTRSGQQQGGDGSITEYILLQPDDKNQVFTYQKNGLVQGRIFRDTDATGTRTLADPGVSGITVYLDQDNDGKLDPGEPRVATAADGVYRFLHTFTPQNPTYNATIRYVLPDGLKAQGATSLPIAITQSQPWAIARNFLIVEPITFSGVAFADLNANGVLDPGEPGLAGERVMVGNDPAVTDSRGYWSVRTNTTGPFNVSVAVPAGAVLTSPNANPYVVDASQRNGFGGLNFGFSGVAAPGGTGVSGVVFSDLNSNGIHDPGEPALPGYAVELTGIDGRQATTSGGVTNPGEFSFAGASDFTFLRTILPTNAIGTTLPFAFPQLVPAFDLASLGIAVGAKVDVRVGPLQGNPALNDFAILTGDRIILRLANANGSSTIRTLTTGLAPATSSGSNNLIVADVNDDKLDDLIASANGGVVIFLSNGFGRFAPPIPVLTSTLAGRDAVVAIDRAKPFPTFYAANTSAAGTAIFSFTWDAAANAPTAPAVVSNSSPIADLAVGDVNGDAITDLILFAQNGKLFTLIGPTFDTVLSSNPLPPPTSKLSVSKLFGDVYDRVTYVGQIDDTHSTLIVGGFVNGALAVTQTPSFITARDATTFALPVNLRGGGNLLQDVLVGAAGDIILFTNPGGPFLATTVFLEGAHFGASASTTDLNPSISPVPTPPASPPVIATGSVPFIVPAGTVGTQTDYSGSLGLEFATVAPILVTTLGIFDSGSDGINGTLTARLYNRDNPSVALATLVFTSSDPGVLVGGSRFKTLARPIPLPAGFQGMIVAEGYGPGEPDGNRSHGPGSWSTDTVGGVLSFSGKSFFGNAGAFPTNPDTNPDAYAAGSFGFVTSTTVIDTASMTVTGDGDNDPRAIFGQPFTARPNNGVVEFIVAGDLAVPSVRITVSGAAPALLVVGGDLTVASGAVFDVSAQGQTAGSGGGLGGAGQSGGGGGTGGANAGGIGAGTGGSGHGGVVAPGTMGNDGFNGRQGSQGNPSSPGNAGLPGGTAFNNTTVGSSGAAGQSVQGGQPGPTGVLGGGGPNGNGIVNNYYGHTGGFGTTPATPSIGTLGMVGGVGGPGANNVPGVGLTGGSGGGGGGGGSGGAGGGAGGGGGSGGGGGGGAGIFGHGGNGGNGGEGGWGGDGGLGATGGTGGVGGAGGGALEFLVYGRFATPSATFLASGGTGLGGTSGPNNSPGLAPNPTTVSGNLVGSAGTAHSGGGGDGGSGGNGAIGAVGGPGGYGGGGGAGGGGAGGTIILAASVLDATTLSVDASGGAGGVGSPTDPSNPSGPHNPNGPAGGLGRFLFNSNTAISKAGWTVAAQQANSISVSSNSPFVSGSPVVPTIPGLVGGAYDYGLVPAGSFTINPAPQTPGAFAAVIRSHLTWNGIDFPGFDQIMLVNLSATGTLTGPMLGAGAPGFLSPLLRGGIANDPLWGGSGPKAIASLAPGSAFVFMVPSSTQLVNAQVIVGNQVHTGSSVRLGNEQVMYLTDGQAAGLVSADLDRDGQADLISVGSDGTLLTWHNVTGGSILTHLSTSHINGGHDIGVHVAGSETGIVQGTVFQDISGSGVWVPGIDPGLSVGVLVYVDLNNNNALDPGEPSKTPSLEGAYQIAGLPMADSKGNTITYHVRLVLGANGVTNTMKQTSRSAVADFAFNVLGGTHPGADFGVQVQEGSNDFDLDGHADFTLTDHASGGVYVQYRNDSGRLRSSKVGTLPGPGWRVGGVGEFTGDATPDIMLANDSTGQLILWELFGGTSPRIARATSPVTPAPAGSILAAIADFDRNGTPDLFFQDGATGRVTVRLMSRRSIIGSRVIPIDYAQGALVDVARIDDDSNLDLLWKTTDGTLAATLLDSAQMRKADVIVGRLSPGSELADSINVGGDASEELIIQDIATSTLRLWTLDAQGRKATDAAIDMGPIGSPLSVQRGRAVSVPDIYATRPLSVLGAGVNATAKSPVTAVVAIIGDVDPTAAAGRYAATVDWGDGTSPTSGTVRLRPEGGFEVIGTHTYANAGHFSVTVSVVDTTRGPEGRRGSGLGSVIVAAPAPPAPPAPPVTGIGPKILNLVATNPVGPGATQIVITFDRALNAARARNIRNYVVSVPIKAGKARRVTVRVAAAIYDPVALTVTLVLRRRADLDLVGRLRIRTTTPRGLTDATGKRITNSRGRPADFFGLFGGGVRIGIKALAGLEPSRIVHPRGPLHRDR